MATPHFERILCPTDFSPFSALALRHALALTRQFGSRLKIVYVIPDPYAGAETGNVGPPWLQTQEVHGWVEAQMRLFLEPAREARIDHQIEVRSGEPWREIVAVAEVMRADLVVLGTHGRSGLQHLFLGSVTERLIRRLPCPVLTVAREEGRTWAAPGLISRILCATDFSDTSNEAVNLAFAIAGKGGAEVLLLHVVENLEEVREAASRVLIDVEALRADVERRSRARLLEVIDGAGEPGVPAEPRAVLGCAYKETLRLAATERIDLIVIGAQGHGLFEHLFSGSNAQHVIRAATCPVLTVRPLRLKGPPGEVQSTGLTLVQEHPVGSSR